MMANVGASIEWFVSKFFQKIKKCFFNLSPLTIDYGQYGILKSDIHAEILSRNRMGLLNR